MGTSEGTHSRTVEPPGGTEPNRIAVSTAEILDLLSDEYTRQLLHALSVKPHSASTLADRLDASRATVYRRLDDLDAAGLVESRVAINGDGHHRNRFHVAIDAIRLRFGDDGVESSPAATSPTTTPTTAGEIDAAALLSVLGDEYTRRVLAVLSAEPLPARRIADRADVSRPTVYRRLNRLTEVGVVETVTTDGLDGQDRQAYHVAVDAIACSLVDGSARDMANTEAEEGTEATETADDRPPLSAA